MISVTMYSLNLYFKYSAFGIFPKANFMEESMPSGEIKKGIVLLKSRFLLFTQKNPEILLTKRKRGAILVYERC